MSRLRFAARVATLALWLGLCLLLHGMWRLFRRQSPWPRTFLGGTARIVGARTRVIGTPLTRDVVFVANHLSWIDILVIAGATGSAFVAKAELATAPLVGWLCTLNNTIFVSREDRLGVADQIATIRGALAAEWPVTIFPEGTTSDGRTILPFKATLLAALEPGPPGVRVQPIRLDYGDASAELAWVGEETGQHHARRVFSRPGSFTVRLHFCDPFDPAACGNRKAIAAEARRRIEAV